MRPTRERLHYLLRRVGGRLYWRVRPDNGHRLAGLEAGCLMLNGYWYIGVDGSRLQRSRIIFCMTHGRWPSEQVDHINRKRADDRPSNLREASAAQNSHNMSPKNRSLPPGVFRNGRRFGAQIRVNKLYRYLGQHDTPAQAHQAYVAARQKYFGEFA